MKPTSPEQRERFYVCVCLCVCLCECVAFVVRMCCVCNVYVVRIVFIGVHGACVFTALSRSKQEHCSALCSWHFYPHARM